MVRSGARNVLSSARPWSAIFWSATSWADRARRGAAAVFAPGVLTPGSALRTAARCARLSRDQCLSTQRIGPDADLRWG